jgi:predicted transcriptional regulator of viral defense system
MNYSKLRKLRGKLYFTAEDVADALGIKYSSSLVVCNRYTNKGLFVRVKRNVYVMEEAWQNYSVKDFLKLSNIMQVPSYISLTTALSFYGITTQVQQNYFESVSLKRSVEYGVKDAIFTYYKLNKRYYFDYVKEGDIFIATKEKAFLDMIYLASFGKYSADFNAIDIDKLDVKRIKKLYKLYPDRTKRIIEEKCRI